MRLIITCFFLLNNTNNQNYIRQSNHHNWKDNIRQEIIGSKTWLIYQIAWLDTEQLVSIKENCWKMILVEKAYHRKIPLIFTWIEKNNNKIEDQRIDRYKKHRQEMIDLSFSSCWHQGIMKDQNMSFHRTPSHIHKQHTARRIIPPIPPKTKEVRTDRYLLMIVIGNSKWIIRCYLKETNQH